MAKVKVKITTKDGVVITKEKDDVITGILVNDKMMTSVGDKMTKRFKRVYDEKLDKKVVKCVETFDIDEFIQSSSNATDLAILKRRYIELGEIPNVDGSQPVYGDLTILPENVHELYHLEDTAEKTFASLPDQYKGAFANSSDFLNHVLKKDYVQVINKYIAAQAPAAGGIENE